jgi:hypothetical protein
MREVNTRRVRGGLTFANTRQMRGPRNVTQVINTRQTREGLSSNLLVYVSRVFISPVGDDKKPLFV